MIRMINKEGNGWADAYDEADAQRYELHGWTRVPEVKEPEPDAPKKRGRPAKAE